MEKTDIHALLTDASHVNRCKGLKNLQQNPSEAEQLLPEIIALLKDDYEGVVSSALITLKGLGPKASPYLPQVLQQALAVMFDKGCTYDCCGLTAYHGPMENYIAALHALDVSGVKVKDLLQKYIQAGTIPKKEADEMNILLEDEE